MTNLKASDPKQIGPYRVIDRLGSGGMGTVYLGRRYNGRLAAVKVINGDASQVSRKLRARFGREIDTAKLVKSRFTARILDSDIEAAQPWYASEYIPGPTLAEAVALNGGSLPLKTIWGLLVSLVEAMRAMHAVGVVHRDLKPQNVILGRDGVKVIDFGIAHTATDSRLTSTETVIGTPSYMCPEQLQGRSPAAVWDMFALGGLLVFAATGRQPFGGPSMSPLEIATAILTAEPNLDGVPTELQAIVVGCLAKDPNDRMQLGRVAHFLPTQTVRVQAVADWVPTAVVTQIDSKTRATQRMNMQAQKRQKRSLEIWGWSVLASTLLVALAVWGGLNWYNSRDDTLPQARPSQKPKLSAAFAHLPPMTFTPSNKRGRGVSPVMPGSFLEVDSTKANGYKLEVNLVANGFAGFGSTPFSDSCLEITQQRNGEPFVRRVYLDRYWYPEDQDGGRRAGRIDFRVSTEGTYRLYVGCKFDKGAVPIDLGTAKVDTVGTLWSRQSDALLEVMSARLEHGNLVVVTPNSDVLPATNLCLRTDSGLESPVGTERQEVGGVNFVATTFKAKKGTLYVSCDRSDPKRPIYDGKGMSVG